MHLPSWFLRYRLRLWAFEVGQHLGELFVDEAVLGRMFVIQIMSALSVHDLVVGADAWTLLLVVRCCGDQILRLTLAIFLATVAIVVVLPRAPATP